jgi:uncharacterized membrane protein
MMMLCGIAWIILLAVGAALGWQLFREERRRRPSAPESQAEALRVLEQRFARGEIGREEFEKRRRVLLRQPE